MKSAVFLEPVDAWSFRDGRPFEAGEAFDAATLFPPSPFSTLGCLRTALLRRHCGDLERYAGRARGSPCPVCGTGTCRAVEIAGPPSGPAPFAVGPPLPACRAPGSTEITAFYPLPADLVSVVGAGPDGGCGAALLRPLDGLPAGAHHSLAARGLAPVGLAGPGRIVPFRPFGAGTDAEPVDWLTATELVSALGGECPKIDMARGRDFAAEEARVGIGMDSRRGAAQEGKLYIRNVIRLEEGFGLAVSLERDLELDGEVARLGGDGRLVRVSRASLTVPSPPQGLDARLKVYLASPCWFSAGDRPRWLQAGIGMVPGTTVGVRLVGAALRAASPIGGWDLARQEPRPMRHMVGAGSVLFLEVTEGDPLAAVRALHDRSICDDSALARAGFGLAFVGRW